MIKTRFKKLSSLILIAAMIMIAACGCTGKGSDNGGAASVGVEKEASKSFKVVVVDREGKETAFEYSTSKETVGEALLDEKLIEGTEGAYGLYVTKVNGIEAVYENDGTYWSFYINGEYAMTGVDTTPVEDGATYMLKVEGF